MPNIELLKGQLIQPRNVKIRLHRPLKDGTVRFYYHVNTGGKQEYHPEDQITINLTTATYADIERVASALNAEAALLRKVIVEGGAIEKHEASKLNFVDYFDGIAKDQDYSWQAAGKYLRTYTGGYLPFAKLTKQWARKYVEWMESLVRDDKGDKRAKKEGQPLVRNTAALYIGKVSKAIRVAIEEDLYQNRNPFSEITKPAISQENGIDYLTEEELVRLMSTPYECVWDIRRSFLFCIYTAMRIGDLRALTWSKVHITSDGYHLEFWQQKKKRKEWVRMPKNVQKLMGEAGSPDQPVFKLPGCQLTMNRNLRKWGEKAGIEKYLHWHMTKHTIGTLLVEQSVPLNVIQKVLMHKTAKSVHVYADVTERVTQQAVSLLPDLTH
jgi:integrase